MKKTVSEPSESFRQLRERIGLLDHLHSFTIKVQMMELLMRLKEGDEWQSQYSRTISAISEDLGITPAKPTFGPIPDTTPGISGDDLNEEGKFSTPECDT